MWRSPVHIHCGVTFHCFAESTLITSFLKLPFLPFSSLASLSNTVSLSLLVSGQLFAALSLLVIWWLSFWCTLMNLVIAFLAHWLLVHNYRIVCMYGLHSSVVFVHPVYSTVCTIVGVLLPYRMHVRAGCMVQKFLHTRCAVTVCTMLVPQFNIVHFVFISKSHVLLLANSTIRLSLLSLLFFPLSL